MANRQQATIPLILGLVLASFVSAFGKLECEDLPVEDCAFSVASSGTRCVLERYKGKDDSIRYECQSSFIMAEKQEEWIESDECVKSCGLERMSAGMSTDLLLDSHFTERLCSSECFNNCPNLIDLYISLAAGEGMYLPKLCESHRLTSRRLIADPVKKPMDAEYQRQILPRLTSGGTLAPAGSETLEIGAETPHADGTRQSAPHYQSYDYRGEIVLTSLVSVPSLWKAPAEQSPTAGEPSINKRPWFIASAPPAQVAATIPPETAPYASAPDLAPAPLPGQDPEQVN